MESEDSNNNFALLSDSPVVIELEPDTEFNFPASLDLFDELESDPFQDVNQRQAKVQDRRFECPENECLKTFILKQHLSTHINTHGPGAQHRYKCDHEECSKSYNYKEDLEKHIANHNKCLRHECKEPECDKTFSRQRHLKEHMNAVHEAKTLQEHPCDLCDKVFFSSGSLNQHKVSHSEDKPYKCEAQDCPCAFRRKQELRKHVDLYHPAEIDE